MTDANLPTSTTPPAPSVDPLAGQDAAALLRQGIDPLAPTESGTSKRPAPPTPQELTTLLPQFDVQELIGQGGMGAVYRAVQRNLDRTVALKILAQDLGKDPGFVSRFVREAKALGRLNHPNLVTIHDYGQAGGWCWLSMEFIDGANLRQVMATGRLSAAQALAIVPQLCDALQYAHDQGVVHRDIKPENILLDGRGRVKIADFGLAKLRDAEAVTGQVLTATGAVMGTVHYMAPEQVEGARDIDHRADIYSLGVVFYEMLTGGLPLGRFEPPSRRIDIDVRLDEVVLKTLEKDPARRYQQAAEVQTAVDQAQGPAPGMTENKTGKGKWKEERDARRFEREARERREEREQLAREDADITPSKRDHFIAQSTILLATSLLTGLVAYLQFTSGEPVGPLWMAHASLVASPLMFFGACCLQWRLLPAWAALGLSASAMPVLWILWNSFWPGVFAALVPCGLMTSIGDKRWDRHFAQPATLPRHVLIVVMAALSLGGGYLLVGSALKWGLPFNGL